MEHKEVITCIKDGKTGVCRDLKDKHAHERLDNVEKTVNTLAGVDGGHLATDEDIKKLTSNFNRLSTDLTQLTGTVIERRLRLEEPANVQTDVVCIIKMSNGTYYQVQRIMAVSVPKTNEEFSIMARNSEGVSRVNTLLDTDANAKPEDIMNRSAVNSKINQVMSEVNKTNTNVTDLNTKVNNNYNTLNNKIDTVDNKINEILAPVVRYIPANELTLNHTVLNVEVKLTEGIMVSTVVVPVICRYKEGFYTTHFEGSTYTQYGLGTAPMIYVYIAGVIQNNAINPIVNIKNLDGTSVNDVTAEIIGYMVGYGN